MEFYKHKYAILKIIVITLIFIIIIGYLIINHYKQHIINNWTHYRNNPFIIPFAGFFRKKNETKGFGEATEYHFKSWTWTLTKSFFSYLIKPIQYIFKLITSIIQKLTNTLNQFRYQAKIMRKLFADIVQSVATKISNSYAAMQYYQAKLLDITKRQQAMFQIMLYFADAMKMTISSLINGPLIGAIQFFPVYGVALLILMAICVVCAASIPFVSWVACPICLICFDKDTPISLENNETLKISKIRLGDITLGGGKVISKMKFYIGNNPCDIYNYNDIIVSGSHLTFEKGRPIRIRDCPTASKIKNNPSYLYCLNTENNYLHIKGRTYCDFQEASSVITNQITQSLIIQALNNLILNTEIYDIRGPTYQWGLAKNTKIKMLNGYVKNIQDIEIGDYVEGGFFVYGIVKHLASYLDVYTDGTLYLSGTQAIKTDLEWTRFYKLINTKKINYKEKYIYHIVTRNHIMITYNNIILTDYLELAETHSVFDKIHNVNLESLSCTN